MSCVQMQAGLMRAVCHQYNWETTRRARLGSACCATPTWWSYSMAFYENKEYTSCPHDAPFSLRLYGCLLIVLTASNKHIAHMPCSLFCDFDKCLLSEHIFPLLIIPKRHMHRHSTLSHSCLTACRLYGNQITDLGACGLATGLVFNASLIILK